MKKNSYYQVKLIESTTFICCAIFSYLYFGISTIVSKCNGFLHINNHFINNYFINKNKYYEFNNY